MNKIKYDDGNVIINNSNKNIIKGLLDIKLKEIDNKNVILFNSNIKDEIDVYLNNEKINSR
jgi:hypothetical protein